LFRFRPSIRPLNSTFRANDLKIYCQRSVPTLRHKNRQDSWPICSIQKQGGDSKNRFPVRFSVEHLWGDYSGEEIGQKDYFFRRKGFNFINISFATFTWIYKKQGYFHGSLYTVLLHRVVCSIFSLLYLGFRPLQNQRPTVWTIGHKHISWHYSNISLNIAILINIKNYYLTEYGLFMGGGGGGL
jgi:hypothetical protein